MKRWVPLVAVVAFGCQDVDRFDTSGSEAYCGSIVDARFIRTDPDEGGFNRLLRMQVEIDTGSLSSAPARITTDDARDGPCEPAPTFDDAVMSVPPEIAEDALSTLAFNDAQEHNLIGWTRSTCRGPMLTILSLLKNDSVQVRLLKPAPESPAEGERDAFALFALDRRQNCDFTEE